MKETPAVTASAIVAALLSSWSLASTSRTAIDGERERDCGGGRERDGACAQASRSASAAPLSSAFAMKPRAPLCSISPP